VPELAVLKTLGFSDATVLGFVLAEAGALCLFGGLVGMALATGFGAMISQATGGQFSIDVSLPVWRMAGIAVVVMTLAVGLLPALRAQRLKIVDALAGR
jgi:putative ABC transport system permease protein